jgi:hypothetical protein
MGAGLRGEGGGELEVFDVLIIFFLERFVRGSAGYTHGCMPEVHLGPVVFINQ